jgi:hypothetical protein
MKFVEYLRLIQNVRTDVIEGNVKRTERRGRRRKKLMDDLGKEKVLELKRGSTSSHFLWNSLPKTLRSYEIHIFEVTYVVLEKDGENQLDRSCEK